MTKNTRLNIAEVRGILNLLTEATVNVTDTVEDMHNRIVHPPFLPSTPIQHLVTGMAGIVYGSVRHTTKFIGGGLDKSLKGLNPSFDLGLSVRKKEHVLAILNGVIGDYLSHVDNPLAIPMQFRLGDETLNWNKTNPKVVPDVSGRILLMVHGLCMNDVRWNHQKHNHGKILASELDFTPLYLVYNSGLHISDNGQGLNSMLESLIENWPVPVEEINMVAHSMGGLVCRSAVYYGGLENNSWLENLKKIIFLGSPHHGAPLEQIGNYVDRLFEWIHYVKPFSRLSKMRSSGITDLRYGNLVEEDWKGLDRFKNNAKRKTPVPLPEKVTCFTVAATKSPPNQSKKAGLIGDGLVTVRSALGHHKNPDKSLGFKESNQYISFDTNHMDLLSNLHVFQKLKEWLLLKN